jgi:glycosyltransferase involved in cell wall biosynthesis
MVKLGANAGATGGPSETPSNRRPDLISVIVPVHNEEQHIGAQLAALAEQRYCGRWELVVVDNRCTDRSMEIARSWTDRVSSLEIVKAWNKKGLNYARNVGAASARGNLLAFCDADDAAMPQWLESLIAAAPAYDMIGGSFEPITANDSGVSSAPDDALTTLPVAFRFRSYVPGGNCAIWKSVAREVRWNEDYRFGSSDVEFSWRAQMAGYSLGFAPNAVMRRRARATAAGLARQYFAYGTSTPLLYRHFRHVGMPRSDARDSLRIWKWLIRSVPRVIHSPQFRDRWIRTAAMRSGRVVGSVRRRVLFL